MMPVSPNTSILLLPEYAGLNFAGPMQWEMIGTSPSSPIIDITLDASCARNLGMALTMEAVLKRCPLSLRLNLQP